MTDHSQLVKLNDLARDIPRTIDNAGTASQNTSLVDDVVTREAITLNIAAPFLIAVSERDQAIEALQARVDALEKLRPHWAQGYSSDSIAAQAAGVALSSLWEVLGARNQTEAMMITRTLMERKTS